MKTNVGAKVQTSLNFSPKGSNVVLLAMVCIFSICLIVGFGFLWTKHEYSWVPFLVAGLLLLVIIPFLFISRKGMDYSSSVPTNIEADYSSRSIAVSTDSRLVTTSEILGILEKCASIAQHYRPLPDADGLVDTSGNPIPNSQGEASGRVRSANRHVQEIVDSVNARPVDYRDEHGLEQQGLPEENGKMSNIGRNELAVRGVLRNRLIDEN